MNQNEATIKQYFALSDLASSDQQAFEQLIDLFSEDAVVQDARGTVSQGRKEVRHFFAYFFADNVKLRHLCRVFGDNGALKAEWAVAGCKNDHQLFAFHGFDTYQFDEQGKMTYLHVQMG